MDKKIITFGDTKIDRHKKVHQHKSPILIKKYRY